MMAERKVCIGAARPTCLANYALVAFLVLFSSLANPATGHSSEKGTPTTLSPCKRIDSLSTEQSESGMTEARVSTGYRKVATMSLGEAIDRAFRENLDLALARAEEEIARGKSYASYGRLLPALELGGLAERTRGRVQGSFGELRDVHFTTLEPQLALAFSVNIGREISESFAATRILDASNYRTLRTEQRLLLGVLELYESLLLSRTGVRIVEDLVKNSEEFLRIARARFEAGIGSGSDVSRAEAKLASDRQKLVLARRAWQEESVKLAVVLRTDPEILLDPSEDEPDTLLLAPSPQVDQEEYISRRPDVLAARLTEVASSDLRRAAWWDLLGPQIEAAVSRSYLGEEANDLKARTDYGVFLVWRISLERLGRIREKSAEEGRARHSYQVALDQAKSEIRIALQDVEAAQANIPLAREEFSAAQANHRISVSRFVEGTAIALEVLDAEDTLAEARFNLARAIVAYNQARARLLAAMGTIDRNLLVAEAAE